MSDYSPISEKTDITYDPLLNGDDSDLSLAARLIPSNTINQDSGEIHVLASHRDNSSRRKNGGGYSKSFPKHPDIGMVASLSRTKPESSFESEIMTSKQRNALLNAERLASVTPNRSNISHARAPITARVTPSRGSVSRDKLSTPDRSNVSKSIDRSLQTSHRESEHSVYHTPTSFRKDAINARKPHDEERERCLENIWKVI